MLTHESAATAYHESAVVHKGGEINGSVLKSTVAVDGYHDASGIVAPDSVESLFYDGGYLPSIHWSGCYDDIIGAREDVVRRVESQVAENDICVQHIRYSFCNAVQNPGGGPGGGE